MKIKFIGTIINQLRTENNLSVEELAKRSGIAAERIEKIEAGEVVPSISSMIRISHALGARLGTLLDAQESTDAVVTRAKQVTKESQHFYGGEAGKSRQLDFYSLAQGMKDRAMEPMIVELEAGGDKVEVSSEHNGEEFIYVLEGSIEVSYKEESYVLNEGDSIYYDSSAPHSLCSASDKSARVLAVIYTP